VGVATGDPLLVGVAVGIGEGSFPEESGVAAGWGVLVAKKDVVLLLQVRV
jgi:hypothetical protein